MKILTLGVWAFGFALLTHISRKHPDTYLYAYEKDHTSVAYMKENGYHPFFFPGVPVPKNIEFVNDFRGILPSIDVVLLVIPNQFIESMISEIRAFLKKGVIIVNLSKWIDNGTLHTVSETLATSLTGIDYTYAVLSGWMIAQELVDGTQLWADIWISESAISGVLREIFETPQFQVRFTSEYRNVELYWALKNIIALYIGFLEWKWVGFSSLGYFLCTLLIELRILLVKLWGSDSIDFSSFSLGGDIIATCFGKSRNRYLWNLVWSWMSVPEALEKLRSEKKHAEWYETLRWLKSLIQWDERLIEFQKIVTIFL